MDALDAGAYAYVYEGAVPRSIKVVLWGPLQAKEMGFPGWTYQDGGETGFVFHTTGRPAKMGFLTSTLIVVRRLGKATLTLYLGGYPSDAPPEQRRLDVRGLVNEAELFLTRLAGEPVRLEETTEVVLLGPSFAAEAPAPVRGTRRGRKGPLFEA